MNNILRKPRKICQTVSFHKVFLRRFLQRWCKTSKTLFQAHLIWLWITIYTIQGVPSRYDILWSPRWPTKIDLQVLVKVVAHSIGLDNWIFEFYQSFFKKVTKVTKTLPNVSKNLNFWWSNPQKGTSILVILVPGGWNHQDQYCFWGKRALEVTDALEVSEGAVQIGICFFSKVLETLESR